MKVVVFFEVGKWEESKECWNFKEDDRASKTILVDEDIYFVEKLYSKLGLPKDLFDLSLNYLPGMCQKSSLVFIKGDDDVTILLGYRDERICQIPLWVIVILKDVFVNHLSDDFNDDICNECGDDFGDACSRDVCGGFHDTFSNVHFF